MWRGNKQRKKKEKVVNGFIKRVIDERILEEKYCFILKKGLYLIYNKIPEEEGGAFPSSRRKQVFSLDQDSFDKIIMFVDKRNEQISAETHFIRKKMLEQPGSAAKMVLSILVDCEIFTEAPKDKAEDRHKLISRLICAHLIIRI